MAKQIFGSALTRPQALRDDPDIIRGREAANAVIAAGGSAMDAALKAIEVAFDETARARSMARRAARVAAILEANDGAQRTACIIFSAPYSPI